MHDNFSQQLIQWQQQHGRHNLPWQGGNPYHIWLSEVMLQQTQVTTVIPYFQRFIARFPNASSLASACEDEVFHLWQGLGYYRRAQNLHQAAKHIAGWTTWPTQIDAWQALPGVGRSTAGAIVSLAFNHPASMLDGNAQRILCRFHAIEEPRGSTAYNRLLWQLTEQHLPRKHAATYTQALMDLGALICRRNKPLCGNCPLKQGCQAQLTNTTAHYPRRRAKKTPPIRHSLFFAPTDQNGQTWIQRRPGHGRWPSLWCFPEQQNTAPETVTVSAPLLPDFFHPAAAPQYLQRSCYRFTHYTLHAEIHRLPVSIQGTATEDWRVIEASPALGYAFPVLDFLKAVAA